MVNRAHRATVRVGASMHSCTELRELGGPEKSVAPSQW